MLDIGNTAAPGDTTTVRSPWGEPTAENAWTMLIARGDVPGVWTSTDGEVEQVGLLCRVDGHFVGGLSHRRRGGAWSSGLSRLGKRVRAELPEAEQAHEQAAWQACVEANAAFWASLHTVTYPVAGRRVLSALRRYWGRYGHVTHPDQVAPRRIPDRVWREVLAEWETTWQRICVICGFVVAQGEPIALHHLRPVASGGTADRENLTYTHARCHRRWGAKPVMVAMTYAPVRDRLRQYMPGWRRAVGLDAQGQRLPYTVCYVSPTGEVVSYAAYDELRWFRRDLAQRLAALPREPAESQDPSAGTGM